MDILEYTFPYPTSSMDDEGEYLTRHLHRALVSLARPHVDTQSETNIDNGYSHQLSMGTDRISIKNLISIC